jgi:manganese/zinc/iron transport system ATP- binding protein
MKKHPSSEFALKISNLSVNYDRTPALWDISLEVPQGRLVALIGPNGAGKSTLMKASLGLIKPLSGQVLFLGESLKRMRKKISYVPQRESVDWDFPITVFDLVLMGRYGKLGLFRWPTKKDKEIAWNCLEKVEMEGFASRQISQLSGGQQQRVFIARSLASEADLYFMDEPLAGIDVASIAVVTKLLCDLREEGKTVFVVHHDLSTVEATYDWVILLNMHMVAHGPVSEFFNAQMLAKTYGRDDLLLDKAVKLTREKITGRGG